MKNLYHTLLLWMIMFSLLLSNIELLATNNSNINMVAPTAAFSANVTGACINQAIQFTDQSTDAPTTWAWTFTPNTVTFQNGTDATSQNPQVSFNAIGQYNVSLTATNADGSNTLEQTNYITIYGQSTAPLNEGFDNAIPPTHWNIINPDNDEGWERTTTTQSDGTMGRVIRMDNYQYNSPGQLDYLILPEVDISRVTSPLLTFDVAYAAFGPNNFETLHVEYSTDCGANFAPTTYSKQDLDLATVGYQGNGWGPSDAAHWRSETVDLIPYKSTGTILSFIQTAGYGNGLFVDNIRVFTNDAPVANFAPSQLIACPGDIVTLNDQSMELPTAWTWSFSPNTVTFHNGTNANSPSPKVSFDQLGAYMITLDVTSDNGASQHSLSYYTIDTGRAPLSEDFSSNLPSDWDVINPDNDEGWEFTTTTQSDGTMGRVIRMDNYQYNAPGQLDYFILPALDISRVTAPMLTFDVAYAAFGPSNSETLHIEYSTDCGATFNTTTYSKSYADLPTVGNQGNGWGPSDAAHWRAETMDLTPYKDTGTILSFIQTAGYGNGLFLDNIRIFANDPPVANYAPSHLIACPGEIITLNDQSTELPTAWTWSFSPNTVSYHNGTNANSQNPQVSFDQLGTYTITIEVSSVLGTSQHSGTYYTIDTGATPIIEDFINSLPSDWDIINPDNDEGWEFTNTTQSDGTMGRVIRMDNYQYNSAGQLDYFILPSQDLSNVTTPTLCFDVAYAAFGPNNFEQLHIEYSTDCGANFAPTSYHKQDLDLATVAYQGNGWGPSEAAHWRSENVDLTPYKSTGTVLSFIQTAGYGNGLFLDNIQIKASHMPVADFSISATTACANEVLSLTDLTTELPSSWTWSFSPNTVTFHNGTNANSQHPEVSFNAYGTYSITLNATNNIGSNILTKQALVQVIGTSTAPLTEDFELAVPPADWGIANSDGQMTWDATTVTGIDGNPTQVVWVDNHQYNASGEEDYLVLPSVDLTGIDAPILYFEVAYAPRSATNFERLRIEYTTDCGAIFSPTSYDKSGTDLATVAEEANSWQPTDASHWRTESLDLTPYKSMKTALRFIQTNGNGNGLFLDNFRIKNHVAPISDFSVSATTVCANETVDLTDLSTEFPSTWEWTFSPNTVTFQNGTSANSQHPQVSFDTYGIYNITLTATNSIGSNIHTKQAIISAIGTSTAPLTEDFELAVPPADWGIANPDGQMTWDATTVTGSDGNSTQAVWVDNHQYNASGEEDYLVLPSVDLTGFTAPTLYFDVAYAPQNGTNSERLRIDYTTDCGYNFSPTSYDKSGMTLATVGEEVNSWTPTDASHWRTESLSLTPYISMQTALRFIQTNGNGNGLFLDHFRIIEEIILPVELLSFKGYEKDCEVTLEWMSASEEQFDYYELERSKDGKNFQSIYTIEGTRGAFQRSYTYTDKSTSFAPYYRLKMLDKDGSFKYSDLILVTTTCDKEEVLTLYPNVVSQEIGSIQVEFSSQLAKEQISIINLYGQTVKIVNVSTERGLNKLTLEVDGLSSGHYYVRLGSRMQGQKLVIL